jgi:hypothetical protein
MVEILSPTRRAGAEGRERPFQFLPKTSSQETILEVLKIPCQEKTVFLRPSRIYQWFGHVLTKKCRFLKLVSSTAKSRILPLQKKRHHGTG